MKIIESGIKDVTAHESVKIIMPSNLYGCELAEDVFVGPFVEIQQNVKISARTKVQSHTFICELVTIGKDCFIGHGVMFINDSLSSGAPAGGDTSQWEETRIGDNVSIGSNATIMPVSICDQVVIGAGAVVTKDITKKGVYVGNPAQKLKNV